MQNRVLPVRTDSLKPFGIEIGDIAIDAVDPGTVAELRRLVTSHCVAVFRGQPIDDGAFVSFLEQFEPLTFTAGERPVDGAPKLNVVTNVGRDKPPRSVFHTDTSYVRRPPSFTALRAVAVPDAGGETLFSNQYHAWDSLPADDKKELQGAEVRHVVSGLSLGADEESECWHPLVRRHPETGRKALYLSTPERCVEVRGTTVDKPGELVEYLYRHSTEPERLYVHRWRRGDVVMWDNRCTMHRADHSGVVGDRVMHRGMCQGDVPA